MLLITSELILVQIGIVLEVLAYYLFRDTKPTHYHGHIEHEPEQVRLTPVENPAFRAAPAAPRPLVPRTTTARDYYKVQDFSVGTRPAEMQRTAKVFYFQNGSEPLSKSERHHGHHGSGPMHA